MKTNIGSCFFFVLETGQTITNCVSVKRVANKKDYEKVLKPCDNILPSICEGVKAKEGNTVLPNSY